MCCVVEHVAQVAPAAAAKAAAGLARRPDRVARRAGSLAAERAGVAAEVTASHGGLMFSRRRNRVIADALAKKELHQCPTS